jgi:hypothetical protein
MASEVRVNQIQSRTGLSTVTFSDAGVSIAGVTTVGILSATGNSVFSGNLNVTGTISGNVSASGVSTFSGGIQGNVTGNLTGNITGSVNATGLSTFSGGINVGDSFIRSTSIGIGTTSTTGRNAGVSTAQGTLIFNSDTGSVQVYNGNAWRDVGKEAMNATGGLVNEYVEGGRVYRAHIFTSSGFFTVNSASPTETVDYLVGGGGGGGGGAGGPGFNRRRRWRCRWVCPE